MAKSLPRQLSLSEFHSDVPNYSLNTVLPSNDILTCPSAISPKIFSKTTTKVPKNPLFFFPRPNFKKIPASGRGDQQQRHNYLLWIGTPVAASFSVAVVIAALAGPQWLFTEEKMTNENYNGTHNYDLKDYGAYLTKYTKSSLWILCSRFHEEVWSCSKIDYFSTEEYSPDPNDSTMAIPYAITKSTPFFLVSGFVLVVSYVLFILASCSQHHTIHYFISGVLYIIAGLLMLIGLIMYISIFKAEIGSKLRPKSSLQPPIFVFNYGESFFLYVLGFIITEFVGVLNVFLYITLEQIGHTSKTMPCLNGPTPKLAPAFSDKDMTELTCLNGLLPNYTCEKHANTPIADPLFPPLGSNRVFFRDGNSRCLNAHKTNHMGNHQADDHAINGENEVNGAILNGGTKFYRPKPTMLTAVTSTPEEPPFRQFPFDYPQEFPLTRTVSTSTDIHKQDSDWDMRYCGIFQKKVDDSETYRGVRKHKEETKKKIRRSKEELFNEFCKKTGRFIRPKNIYYIDHRNDEENDLKDNIVVIDPSQNPCEMSNQYGKIRRSKSFQNSFQEPMYYSQFDQELYNRKHNFMYQSQTLPRTFLKSSNSYHRIPNVIHNLNLSNGCLNRSCENYLGSQNDYNWPKCIPTSPSAFSVRSLYHINAFQPPPLHSKENSIIEFDLDKMEQDRRKSHASLFQMSNRNSFDHSKSTAV